MVFLARAALNYANAVSYPITVIVLPFRHIYSASLFPKGTVGHG
jgi:hypothetical protein